MEGDEFFQVPEVIDELSAKRVLAMELVQGVPLDSCVDLDQETRNQVRVSSEVHWRQEGRIMDFSGFTIEDFCKGLMKVDLHQMTLSDVMSFAY